MRNKVTRHQENEVERILKKNSNLRRLREYFEMITTRAINWKHDDYIYETFVLRFNVLDVEPTRAEHGAQTSWEILTEEQQKTVLESFSTLSINQSASVFKCKYGEFNIANARKVAMCKEKILMENFELKAIFRSNFLDIFHNPTVIKNNNTGVKIITNSMAPTFQHLRKEDVEHSSGLVIYCNLPNGIRIPIDGWNAVMHWFFYGNEKTEVYSAIVDLCEIQTNPL